MAKGLPRSLKNAKPSANKAGVAKLLPFQAQLAGGETLPNLVTAFNLLLTNLKASGAMKPTA